MTKLRVVRRDIVGAFIFSADDKILLGKTGVYSGLWAVPGGGIDEGETKMQALQRETLEETGIQFDPSAARQFRGVFSGESEKVLKGTNEKVLVKMQFYNYEIRLSKKAIDVEVKTEDDFFDAKWFSKEELRDIPMSPPTITSLQKLGYL